MPPNWSPEFENATLSSVTPIEFTISPSMGSVRVKIIFDDEIKSIIRFDRYIKKIVHPDGQTRFGTADDFLSEWSDIMITEEEIRHSRRWGEDRSELKNMSEQDRPVLNNQSRRASISDLNRAERCRKWRSNVWTMMDHSTCSALVERRVMMEDQWWFIGWPDTSLRTSLSLRED